MSTTRALDDPRRRLLIRALGAGLFAAGAGGALLRARAQVLGAVPGKLPPGRSIYRLERDVKVNGAPATLKTVIGPGDVVSTGAGGFVIFVVEDQSHLLRENSEMRLEGDSALVRSLRLVTGALLSVFGKSKPKLATTAATIGIRGTGVYMESEPDLSYICTCYGTTEIAASADPNATETIVSEHHDAPRYVLSAESGGKLILPAPFKNHDDEELAIIEALVGREPPFAIFGEGYGTTGTDSYGN